MTFLIALALLFGGLFAIGFFSRRSMGAPSMGMIAGYVLSGLWAVKLAPAIASYGFQSVVPPLVSILAFVITLAPALMILMRTHKSKGAHHTIVGSLVFALLGTCLLYEPFKTAVVLDEASRPVSAKIDEYFVLLLTIALIISIIDAIMHHKPVAKLDKKHH